LCRKIGIVALAAKARASKSIIASVNDSNLDLWFEPMNLRSLDLNLLVVFDQLMETRSVTGTAQMLGLTQSTVSTVLDRLRAATKERLLERQGNKMVPTHAALAIWPEIRAALYSIETAIPHYRFQRPICPGSDPRRSVATCGSSAPDF
jgi:DNA-binding transcriptional LysR family regulator